MTPLHHVVTIGDLDLLAEFLVICPESIRDHLRMHCLLHLTVLISHFHDCGGSIKIKMYYSILRESHLRLQFQEMGSNDNLSGIEFRVLVEKNQIERGKRERETLCTLTKRVMSSFTYTTKEVTRRLKVNLGVETITYKAYRTL